MTSCDLTSYDVIDGVTSYDVIDKVTCDDVMVQYAGLMMSWAPILHLYTTLT